MNNWNNEYGNSMLLFQQSSLYLLQWFEGKYRTTKSINSKYSKWNEEINT